jgi:hypothetical protein
MSEDAVKIIGNLSQDIHTQLSRIVVFQHNKIGSGGQLCLIAE